MKTFGISVTLHFRASHNEGRKGRLYYQIIANRKVHQISSRYSILPKDWDTTYGKIRTDNCHTLELSVIKRRTIWEIRKLHQMARTMLEEENNIDFGTLANSFRNAIANQSLNSFVNSLIYKLKNMNKIRRCEIYKSALASFIRFLKNEDMMLYEFTSELMEKYQEHLISTGITMNTISFYMRQLRAIYNIAVKRNITEQTYPFANVYTGIADTVKRSITKDKITAIKNLELSHTPHLALARDMFILSFYMRGISFVDMVFLKKNNLNNGYITYIRHKTGQRLTIKWEPQMQDIIDRYPCDSEFLLPFITPSEISEHRQYKNASKMVNRNLKTVAKLANLHTNLTMYVARHSLASIAKQINVPINIISEGLGHNCERTTQIYLATLDSSPLDKANSTIITLK